MIFRWVLSITAAFYFTFLPFAAYAQGSTDSGSSNNSVSEWINDKSSSTPAKQSIPATVSAGDSTGGTFLMIVKLVFMLAIVLGILIFILRFIQKRTVSFQEGKVIQSLGGAAVGPNRSVQLVKAGNSLLVLGVGENVTLLKEITDEKEIENIQNQQQPAIQGPQKSLIALRSLLKSKQELKSKENEGFKALFQKELFGLTQERKKLRTGVEENENHE